ncbi:MAG: DUF1836 domain-containing protein [Clostridiales bacterium]|uniref:DUF1836 domain-containing protein n=1 Tax=Clostridia TaxID=186801 RepID=UPI0018AA290E|nr:DUF1836 domain-containing protein [Clostridium sp. 1001270J_160509_D11]MDU1202474.1 DUF1836 domain-containing protein [Clostridiales bacterium]
MDFKDSHYIKEILEFHLPRFNELPDIDLYMDQVLNIIENSLIIFSSENDENIITKSMINNYVKQNVIEKPFKKRYKKFHVAYLIIISILKKVLSISEISKIINNQDYEVEEFYNMFCNELEYSLKSTFLNESKDEQTKLIDDNIHNKILVAATRAFANKVYVQKLIEFNEEEMTIVE